MIVHGDVVLDELFDDRVVIVIHLSFLCIIGLNQLVGAKTVNT